MMFMIWVHDVLDSTELHLCICAQQCNWNISHYRVRKQVVNIPSFVVRLDSQKHIDFSLRSPYGGGRPGKFILLRKIEHQLKKKKKKEIEMVASYGNDCFMCDCWGFCLSKFRNRYNKSVNHNFCFLFFFRPCQEEERQEGNNRGGGRLIVHLMTIKSFTFKCCIFPPICDTNWMITVLIRPT